MTKFHSFVRLGLVYLFYWISITYWLFNAEIWFIYKYLNQQEGRVFANDPGDRGLIPGRVIPKTLKMVLDTSLLNTQQYKVRIKGKVERSWERSSALPYISV